MEIICFDEIDSTQTYLINEIENGRLKAPVAILASMQTAGIGSRDNKWISEKGNFFASFAVPLKDLPTDLKLASASIYFGSIMSEILKNINSEVWLKWPNDIYKNENKIAGIITKKINDSLVCGIGINFVGLPEGLASIETEIEPIKLLSMYLDEVEQFPKWKQVFSKVQLEFHKSKILYFNIEKYQNIIRDAIMCNDGSLLINGERVYSLR